MSPLSSDLRRAAVVGVRQHRLPDHLPEDPEQFRAVLQIPDERRGVVEAPQASLGAPGTAEARVLLPLDDLLDHGHPGGGQQLERGAVPEPWEQRNIGVNS